MSKAIIKKEKRLPNRQRRHPRRYKSGKVTIVNPKNTLKNIKPLKSPLRKPSSLAMALRRQQKPIKLTPKIRTPWTKILKKDTSTPSRAYELTKDRVMPSEERKVYTVFDPKSALDDVYDYEYCEQNCEEFEESYVIRPMTELKEDYESGLISLKDAELKRKDIVDEAIFVLENDLQDPPATIEYAGGDIFYIGHYKNMVLEDGIDAVWKRSGGWRGYYDITVDPDSDWTKIYDDCSLSGSDDQKNLMKFDEEFRDYMDANDLDWARAVCRSSNVLSAGVDYLVKKKDVSKVKGILDLLKNKYRDPQAFEDAANPIYKDLRDAAKKVGPDTVRKAVKKYVKSKDLSEKFEKEIEKAEK